jgi:amino acid transporter
MAKLSRTLGVASLTFYGVGMIVGAGVYSIVGAAAGEAGDALWVSFALGAVVALLTGLSYAELAPMFPTAGAEYVYLRHAFPRARVVSFVVGVFLVAAATATAATVALAFAGYVRSFVRWPTVPVALGLVAVSTAVNVVGIRESSRLNVVFTCLEVAGLVVFVVLGAGAEGFGEALLATPGPGVFAGAALVFFAYLGFEDIANLAEEARRPSRDLPRAIFASLAVTTLLYVLVAIAAVALAEPERLAESEAPLVEAARGAAPRVAGALGALALFATANTALIALISGSRMLYGMARERDVPAALGLVLAKRSTPWAAALAVAAVAGGLVCLGDLSAVASLSSLAALVAFAAVNLVVIVLRYKEPGRARPFRAGPAIGRFPVLAGAALVTAAALASQFGGETYGLGAIVLAVAAALHFARRLFVR